MMSHCHYKNNNLKNKNPIKILIGFLIYSYVIIIESFENFNKEEDLIIVDVQKSFRKFFS